MMQGVPSLFQSVKVWVRPFHLQVYFQNHPLKYRLWFFNISSLDQITTTVNSCARSPVLSCSGAECLIDRIA